MRPRTTIIARFGETRRRLAALASCLLLMLSQLLGCLGPLTAPSQALAATLPDVIHATTDKDAFAGSSMPTLTGDIHNIGGTNPATGQSYLSYATAWRTQEGFMGYCVSTLNNHHTPADGDWLTYRKNRLMDPELAYILRHGYPFTNTIGGVTFSDADARLVTQFAFWLITDEDFNADSGNPWKTGTAVPAARRLVADARAHGAEEAKRNQFWVYTTNDGEGYQDLVLGIDSTGGLKIKKSSNNAQVSSNNGRYDLAGAVYGLYEDEDCTKEAARLTTDAAGEAQVEDLLSGTYYLKELTPAKGYALDQRVHVVEVPGGDIAAVEVSDVPQTCPIEIAVHKLDAEKGEAEAQGGGTLEGAEFRLDFYAGNYDAGNLPDRPAQTWTLRTSADGTARLDASLPLGTVAVTETKAPKGYLPEGRTQIVHITSEGTAETVHTYLAPSAEDLPIRGDVSFVKADEDSQRRMANVAFRITSATTGESHIAVTDENGIFDSTVFSADEKSNANDAAVDASGTVDDEKLAPDAGIWFGEASADRSRGSLLYDVYELEELRCAANEGHRLVSASFTVSREGRIIHLGTFDDKEVRIGTTLSYRAGEKVCPADSQVELIDEVAFENLEAGHGYVLEGELHLIDADGTDKGVVSDTRAEFSPRLSSGTQQVSFSVDTTGLGGKKLVAYERLLDGDDVIAEHADPNDEGQTVTVPSIGTTLEGNAGHEADATAQAVRLVDTVEYRGLEPGASYEVTGTLHIKDEQGNDAGALTDADGNPVTAQATFCAEESDGLVEVVFEFSDVDVAGKDLVAFEAVGRDGIDYAVHADIEDEGQTVSFPRIRTTATGGESSDHLIAALPGQIVNDTVEYRNLLPGATYRLEGEVHVRSSAGTDEEAIASSNLEFTPQDRAGEATLGFEVDASELGGKTLVVFERLYREGEQVGSHEDIEDEGQSVYVPAIGTTLAGDNGAKQIEIDPGNKTQITLEDTVEYVNLVPGNEYKLRGKLIRKGTGEEVAHAEKTFVPDAPNGYEKVSFGLDASDLANDATVAFEALSYGDMDLAEHADLEDEGQTVFFARKPETPQTPKEDTPEGALPSTGEEAIPMAALVILGGMLAFVAWAIVRGGSMGAGEDW